MKKAWLLCLILVLGCDSSSGDISFTNLAPFPFPIGAAGVAIYNNELYVFGGSGNYDGDTTYASIYKFNGSTWVAVDTMLNANTWDGKLLIDNSMAYYVNGWPGQSGSLQRYNFSTHTWAVLDTVDFDDNWGSTAQLVGNSIYHFGPAGSTEIYNIGTGAWTPGNSNTLAPQQYNTLVSAVYNGNIFVAGYGDSVLYKYTVSSGVFSVESQMPRPVNACAMVQFGGKLYFIGGSSEYQAQYSDIVVYDVGNKSWTTSSIGLMSPVVFPGYTLNGNELILIGGFDPNGDGTNTVSVLELQ